MYTPLKITSDYSILKSLIKIDDLIPFLVEKNIKACALVDENLFGVLEFYTKLKKNNIKPIIGLEIYLKENKIYLYAKNYEGYKDLLKIHSLKENRPIEISDLLNYAENILVIVPFSSRIVFESLNFFNDLYLSYENEYEKRNSEVITNKNVYLNEIKCLKLEDVSYLEYLDKLANREKGKYANNYYKDTALADSDKINEIVNKLNLELNFNKRYIPKYKENVDSTSFLTKLAHKGLAKRLNNNVSKEYLNRLDYELKVIIDMGFVDYFLIVYDYVLFAKKHNILVGCRGSAAGSLVSYAIGITDVDPLKYNLIFERFLNPARVTMPDVDIDFDANRRDEVINYVKEKYGFDKVAGGITFATMKTKLVLRESAKILKINSAVLENFLKSINGDVTLMANLLNLNVKKYLQNYPELKKLYQVALKLEGLKKNISTHAAGIVISSKALDEIIPVYHNKDELITGITMEYLEMLGLLKMDFLGLKNLNFIARVLNHIPNLKITQIPLNDKNVFNLFNTLDVEGIFQFETPAMKKFLTKFKIDSFNDLIASLALVRPGAKEHIDTYIRRKKGYEKITYITKELEPILKDTYGVILYQEQIMAILTKIANYSMQEADIVRRAISKKKESVLQEEKTKFITKAVANHYTKVIAEEIYDEILKFASYGFNKAHSVSYAYLSYQMAYLKVYFLPYFLLERLNEVAQDKIPSYLNILKKHKINIVKPSILNHNITFEIMDNNLIMPLTTIKNINLEITKKIGAVNKDGFTDYFDFLIKTKDFLTIDQIKILIKGEALDFLKYNHPTLLNNLENALNYVALADGNYDFIKKPAIVEYPDMTKKEKRLEEFASFGFYISVHPACIYENGAYVKIINKDNYLFKKVKMGVLVTKITNIKTKKNEDMAFMTGEDETGECEFLVFPNVYKEFINIKINDLVVINGMVTKRFDKIQIIVNNIKKDGE